MAEINIRSSLIFITFRKIQLPPLAYAGLDDWTLDLSPTVKLKVTKEVLFLCEDFLTEADKVFNTSFS